MKFIYKVGIDPRSTEIKFHVDTMIITDLIITDFTYNGQKKSGPSQLECACFLFIYWTAQKKERYSVFVFLFVYLFVCLCVCVFVRVFLRNY